VAELQGSVRDLQNRYERYWEHSEVFALECEVVELKVAYCRMATGRYGLDRAYSANLTSEVSDRRGND
jgi:hypothetical protein